MSGNLSQGMQSPLYGLVGKTLIYEEGVADGAATTTIYTVTVGKTFYLLTTGLTYGTSAVGAGYATLCLNSTANVLLQLAAYAISSGGTGQTYQAPYPVAAGTAFKVVSDFGNMRASAWIIGWED